MRRLGRGLIISLLAILWMATSVKAQTITQSYGADDTLQRGMLVALKKSDPQKVEAIARERAEDLFGVVVGSNDSTIVLSEDKQPVLVATTGRFQVLVSDQNGSVKSGDNIVVSSVKGIGMKADTTTPTTIGKALDDFSGSSSAGFVTSTKVKGADGQEITINIGRVGIDIAVGKNPRLTTKQNAPLVVQAIAENIAGKEIPVARVYASLVLLLAAFAVAGSVIYGSVRSGMISIGRNPLSRRLIIGGILQMVLVSFIVFFVGLIGVYLLLKL